MSRGMAQVTNSHPGSVAPEAKTPKVRFPRLPCSSVRGLAIPSVSVNDRGGHTRTAGISDDRPIRIPPFTPAGAAALAVSHRWQPVALRRGPRSDCRGNTTTIWSVWPSTSPRCWRTPYAICPRCTPTIRHCLPRCGTDSSAGSISLVGGIATTGVCRVVGAATTRPIPDLLGKEDLGEVPGQRLHGLWIVSG